MSTAPPPQKPGFFRRYLASRTIRRRKLHRTRSQIDSGRRFITYKVYLVFVSLGLFAVTVGYRRWLKGAIVGGGGPVEWWGEKKGKPQNLDDTGVEEGEVWLGSTTSGSIRTEGSHYAEEAQDVLYAEDVGELEVSSSVSVSPSPPPPPPSSSYLDTISSTYLQHLRSPSPPPPSLTSHDDIVHSYFPPPTGRPSHDDNVRDLIVLLTEYILSSLPMSNSNGENEGPPSPLSSVFTHLTTVTSLSPTVMSQHGRVVHGIDLMSIQMTSSLRLGDLQHTCVNILSRTPLQKPPPNELSSIHHECSILKGDRSILEMIHDAIHYVEKSLVQTFPPLFSPTQENTTAHESPESHDSHTTIQSLLLLSSLRSKIIGKLDTVSVFTENPYTIGDVDGAIQPLSKAIDMLFYQLETSDDNDLCKNRVKSNGNDNDISPDPFAPPLSTKTSLFDRIQQLLTARCSLHLLGGEIAKSREDCIQVRIIEKERRKPDRSASYHTANDYEGRRTRESRRLLGMSSYRLGEYGKAAGFLSSVVQEWEKEDKQNEKEGAEKVIEDDDGTEDKEGTRIMLGVSLCNLRRYEEGASALLPVTFSSKWSHDKSNQEICPPTITNGPGLATFQLGRCYLMQREYDKAVEIVTDVIKGCDPDRTVTTDDTDDAPNVYNDPDDNKRYLGTWWYILGHILSIQGKYEDGYDAMRKALRIVGVDSSFSDDDYNQKLSQNEEEMRGWMMLAAGIHKFPSGSLDEYLGGKGDLEMTLREEEEYSQMNYDGEDDGDNNDMDGGSVISRERSYFLPSESDKWVSRVRECQSESDDVERWILKPLQGSDGTGVFLLPTRGSNSIDFDILFKEHRHRDDRQDNIREHQSSLPLLPASSPYLASKYHSNPILHQGKKVDFRIYALLPSSPFPLTRVYVHQTSTIVRKARSRYRKYQKEGAKGDGVNFDFSANVRRDRKIHLTASEEDGFWDDDDYGENDDDDDDDDDDDYHVDGKEKEKGKTVNENAPEQEERNLGSRPHRRRKTQSLTIGELFKYLIGGGGEMTTKGVYNDGKGEDRDVFNVIVDKDGSHSSDFSSPSPSPDSEGDEGGSDASSILSKIRRRNLSLTWSNSLTQIGSVFASGSARDLRRWEELGKKKSAPMTDLWKTVRKAREGDRHKVYGVDLLLTYPEIGDGVSGIDFDFDGGELGLLLGPLVPHVLEVNRNPGIGKNWYADTDAKIQRTRDIAYLHAMDIKDRATLKRIQDKLIQPQHIQPKISKRISWALQFVTKEFCPGFSR